MPLTAITHRTEAHLTVDNGKCAAEGRGGFPPSTSPTKVQQHFRQPSRFKRRLYTQNSEMLKCFHQLLFGSKIRRKVTSKGRDSWPRLRDFHREHNMSRFLVLVLLTAMTALGTEVTTPTGPSNQTTLRPRSIRTFSSAAERPLKAPHGSGGVAPMSFTVLRKHTSMGQGNQGRCDQQEDAAMVCRPAGR